jgi:hypothetical protein
MIRDVREPFKMAPPKELPELHKKSLDIQDKGADILGVSPKFSGSHFLTTDGRLLGTGKSEHRTMAYMILKNFKDEKFNDMAKNADAKTMSRWGTDGRNMRRLLEQTGMLRVSGNKTGINVDAKHPLTSSQRRVIMNHIEDNDLPNNRIFIDDYTPTQKIEKSILRRGESALTFKEEDHPRGHPDNAGQFTSKGGGSTSSLNKGDYDKSKDISQDVPRYSDVESMYNQFENQTDKINYSFDPTTGKGYDAMNKEDAIELFNNKTNENRDPVYFIGITNHEGGLSRRTEAQYKHLVSRGFQPLIGKWTDEEKGHVYNDISFTLTGVNENEILAFKKKHVQEAILKLSEGGVAEFI